MPGRRPAGGVLQNLQNIYKICRSYHSGRPVAA